MTHLTSLTLNNFRSYREVSFKEIPHKNIVLCGRNGAGKTNILEALSLLAPGRGLRGAKVSEMQNTYTLKEENGWSLHTALETHYGQVSIGIGRNLNTERHSVHVNQEPAKSRTALGEWLSCLWLTPQMDRLFLDEKSARRRFFDRLVYTFDPAHMGRLTRYENAMRQRLKLLREDHSDANWVTGIESQMAETAIAIIAARQNFCDQLQNAYIKATREEKENFPSAKLSLAGETEILLKAFSALQAENSLKNELCQNRIIDGASGMTRTGPHRSDFAVTYDDKNMAAANCSTGEQKALLIGIILAHARLLKEERGAAPLLLLDEVVAHLDPQRRKILSDILSNYPSQVWMSGTDAALFMDFKPHSALYEVADSSVSASPFKTA